MPLSQAERGTVGERDDGRPARRRSAAPVASYYDMPDGQMPNVQGLPFTVTLLKH